MCSFVFLGFFFQAEDGIRDFHVTGVQTCALPISLFHVAESRPRSQRKSTCAGKDPLPLSLEIPMAAGRRPGVPVRQRHGLTVPRSEERRVGKGCGSRWTQDLETKENRLKSYCRTQ